MTHQVNQEIKAKEIRLIGADGEQIGVKSLQEALQIAEDADLDLVNIAPTANPPVCRIMDYGKFRYELQKKEKELRKNQKVVEIKEIRLTPVINEHDFQTKLRSVEKFLKEGNKVKITMKFRGRAIVQLEVGKKVMKRLAESVQELGGIEREPKLDGKSMLMVLNSKAS